MKKFFGPLVVDIALCSIGIGGAIVGISLEKVNLIWVPIACVCAIIVRLVRL
ncbi:hypothetical protein KW784_01795 [Candidatus Parcubacteria bacterium]|nr:hypothetical protein [Candidatus Parcubacteria bacterium]